MFPEVGYQYWPRQEKEGKELLCWMTEKHRNETVNLKMRSQQDTEVSFLCLSSKKEKKKTKRSLAYGSCVVCSFL